MDLKKEALKIIKSVKDNRGPIAIAVGTAGLITTTIWAVKDTPKAMKLIEEAEEEKKAPLTRKEAMEAAWKCYIPSAVLGTLSVSCIVFGCKANSDKQAMMATACSLSETALKEYRDSVKEVLDEKQQEEVEHKVAEKELKRNPDHSYIRPKENLQLCYESLSGRYFESTIDKLQAIEAQLNYILVTQDYVSLNTYYDHLGLDTVDGGDDKGWETHLTGDIHMYFLAELAPDGTPCILVKHGTYPEWGI